MSMEKAKKELEKREAKLGKLTDEKTKLCQTIESLKAERSAAIRQLAAGDSSQRKRIIKFESEIKEKNDLLEGQEIHIKEAEVLLYEAKAALKAAEAERERECQNYISEGIGRDSNNLYKEFSELSKEIAEALIPIEIKMGDMSIIQSILEVRRDPRAGELFKSLPDFPGKVQAAGAEIGLLPLDGGVREVSVIASIATRDLPKGYVAFPRSTRANAEFRNQETIKKLRKEFEEIKRNE